MLELSSKKTVLQCRGKNIGQGQPLPTEDVQYFIDEWLANVVTNNNKAKKVA